MNHAWWKSGKSLAEGVLPVKLAKSLQRQDPRFINQLSQHIARTYQGYGTPKTFAWLWNLYVDGSPIARQAIHQMLKVYTYHEFYEVAKGYYHWNYNFRSGYRYTLVTLRNDSIRYVKAIYKSVEAEQDEELWPILAYRFDANRNNQYSKKTRHYLRRRTWRYLRQLGEAGSDAYVRLATQTLLNYDDEDGVRWAYLSPLTRTYYTSTRFTRLWLFNHILHHNSQRFHYKSSQYWQDQGIDSYPALLPEEREEAFPKLWDKHPDLLFLLVRSGKVEPVVQFAGRALRSGNPAYVQAIDETILRELLADQLPARRSFAAGVILDRLDPAAPDFAQLFPLITSNCHFVRAVAKQFIIVHSAKWSIEQIQDFVQQFIVFLQTAQNINQQIVDDLLELLEGPLRERITGFASIALAKVFLDSSWPALREFAAVVLSSVDLERNPFTGTDLLPFLTSTVASVREAAEQLLDQYDAKLQLDANWLAAWICTAPEESHTYMTSFLQTRKAWIVPVPDEFINALWRYLLGRDVDEQIQAYILDVVFATIFKQELRETPIDRILALLAHDNTAYQAFAANLIQWTGLDARKLSFQQLLTMVHNQVAAVRAEARRLIMSQPKRITADWLYNLIETDWADTREWMMDYLRSLPSEQISPDLIYGLLDTARLDVQELAMELVQTHEQELDLRELMLRGSEHPHLPVQTYVLTLAEKMDWDVSTLQQMELFFRTVLLRVNQGRKAKKMALQLLFKLSEQQEAFAQQCVPILVDTARNHGTRDFETILRTLTKLKLRYPGLAIPISVEAESVTS